jgi:hypothetical protein
MLSYLMCLTHIIIIYGICTIGLICILKKKKKKKKIV